MAAPASVPMAAPAMVARDGGGALANDVPVQIDVSGAAGVLALWNHGGVRMIPRRDRATAPVTIIVLRFVCIVFGGSLSPTEAMEWPPLNH